MPTVSGWVRLVNNDANWIASAERAILLCLLLVVAAALVKVFDVILCYWLISI